MVTVARERRRGENSTFKNLGSVYGIYLYLFGQYEG